jgi:hypothetical protein
MIKMDELKEIKKLINKARSLTQKQDEITNSIYDILEELGVNIDASTGAENASALNDAITCYIQYGEYSIDAIIKEIEDQLKVNRI